LGKSTQRLRHESRERNPGTFPGKKGIRLGSNNLRIGQGRKGKPKKREKNLKPNVLQPKESKKGGVCMLGKLQTPSGLEERPQRELIKNWGGKKTDPRTTVGRPEAQQGRRAAVFFKINWKVILQKKNILGEGQTQGGPARCWT